MLLFVLSAFVTICPCFGQQSVAIASYSQTPGDLSVNSSNPCAQLSAQSAAYFAANESAQQVAFPPSLVLDCFRDVPINGTFSVDYIDWIQAFVQFQTTLAWLKDPPPSYLRAPIDIVGSLNNISQRVVSDAYTNEFDFEVDILTTVNAAADLHFSYQPYLPAALSYGASDRNCPLVSVSLDGTQLPAIYFLSDMKATISSNSTFNPVAVTAINGRNPEVLLDHLLQYNLAFTDSDAAYNSMFANPVPIVLAQTGVFDVGFDPALTDTTSYTFANGSQTTITNTISVPPFPSTFTSGQDLYDILLLGQTLQSDTDQTSAQTSSRASVSAASTSISPQPLYPGYPTPVIAQAVAASDQPISGYFLPEGDVAVLSLPSFDYFDEEANVDFQSMCRSFLSMCTSSGKTSLIIDVRGNIGGHPELAWDLFKQLLPGIVPYTKIRTRATAATDALGLLTSRLQAGLPSEQNVSAPELWVSSNISFFNYHTTLKSPDGPHFNSWSELFGPIASHGDNFTNAASWLLSDAIYTEESADMVISGYGNQSDVPASPFRATQITLLSDGICSSACAIFANLLVDQGVQTVSVGGRPTKDPMAFIGGTQGAEEVAFSYITELAQVAIEIAKAINACAEVQLLEPLTRSAPLQASPLSRISVNVLDNIGKDDESLTPLQFTRLLADCRMFYTPRDMVDVQNTWQRVADGVESGGKRLCVSGSLTATHGGMAALNSEGSVVANKWLSVVAGCILALLLL